MYDLSVDTKRERTCPNCTKARNILITNFRMNSYRDVFEKLQNIFKKSFN